MQPCHPFDPPPPKGRPALPDDQDDRSRALGAKTRLMDLDAPAGLDQAADLAQLE